MFIHKIDMEEVIIIKKKIAPSAYPLTNHTFGVQVTKTEKIYTEVDHVM